MAKEKPLTEKQTDLLKTLEDDAWMFPDKTYRESTFEALVDRGYAVRELRLAAQSFAARTAHYRSAYQRTAKGQEAASK